MIFRDLRDGRAVVAWELPGEIDPFPLAKYKAFSVQVSGSLGGGRVDLMGTNEADPDPVWAILNDPNGNPLTFQSQRIEQIMEDCVKIAPRYVGPPASPSSPGGGSGAGGTSLKGIPGNPLPRIKVSVLISQER
jgi:hypothetical protein